MPFKLQQIPPESKFCHHLRMQVLEACYPRELVSDLLSACHAWEQRERKLSHLLIVYYVIALSLFRQFNVTEVFAHLSRGLRWVWPDPGISLPTGGALTARRQSLGIVVMRLLFRRCCRPLASEATTGAFALGLRLMAIDGTLDEVPETPANTLHFGRLTSGKSQSPFPQVRCLYLAEVGTHAIIDAVFARCKASEQALCWSILRSIESAMLVMTDRNFLSVNWLPAARTCNPTDPAALHRLVTTLLDPAQAPALELIGLYHERWEIELVIDEIKTHQRLSAQPLRSKSPELVYQELYGLLLAHYAVRAWMHQSALQADLDPDRLSFSHALHVLDTACYEFAIVEASELPRLHARLLADLRDPKTLLPARRLRFCPRVVKRAFSCFHRKQRWHPSFHLKNSSFRDILLI